METRNVSDLEGFTDEFAEYPFHNFLDWFIKINDPVEKFKAQPTYIISEWVFITSAVVCLIHSFVVGGRWKYLWLGCFLQGLALEMLALWAPDIDFYWHSQSTIMLVGRRLPLHITLLYPLFMYIAAYTVAHLKLPMWAEPLAAGLGQVLIDLPYDIICVKFLHWTWHDTDPITFDRHYWVPWTSYFFHLSYGVTFHFALNFWRRCITGTDDKGEVSCIKKEVLCALLGGLCGIPVGILHFLVFYYPLHNIYGIHNENCFLIVVGLYMILVWSADRNPTLGARLHSGEHGHWSRLLIILNLVVHYGVYLSFAIFGSPENEVSIGMHEIAGPCDEYITVPTAFGEGLRKRKYLCLEDYDEPYFDFHCQPGGMLPSEGVQWYTICGTPFTNQAEYISIMATICIFAAIIFYNLLFKSSRTLVHKVKQKML
ncbi:uncharacterized protein LOC143039413 [Oratosquilla oratoria]|uniref:uncharacterized protein LOC143039413 n=1 Tax=Oratosquilla oratoria TaxID=337810 RepID=UPI003F766DAA